MKDITIKKITEIAPFTGPHELPGIQFRPVREALGVTAWGMNVLELEAGCDQYPEHDHRKDGQEEVYVVLEGSVVFQANGEEQLLSRGEMVRVAPEVRRKFVTRDSRVTLLALGCKPGEAYTPGMGS